MVFEFLALGSSLGYAQDKVPGIIVELANGEKIEYRLTDNPKMEFDGQTITLTADGVHVEYSPLQLLKVRTGDVQSDGSGIAELASQEGEIMLDAGFVRLSGFKAGETVCVYSLSGLLTASYQISSDGSLMLPVPSLPSGISIIKVNQQTIKITKR